MLSINTNLSSLIAQNSMQTSTNKLNQAIERMTTGAKINHAKDNAANYSINTNMTTKISAYDVAANNVAMGMDMVSTASDTLAEMQNHAERLRALATQARNGTYGGQSLDAIQSEMNAIVDEIERMHKTTEFDGSTILRDIGSSKFMVDIVRRDTSEMVTLESVDKNVALTSGTYSISTAQELAKLAAMTNSGLIGANTEFVLTNDIDLAEYENWTPIGYMITDSNGKIDNNLSRPFLGSFDGNGYIVSNLNIDNSVSTGSGLFGFVRSPLIKICNLGIIDANISSGARCGGLVGYLSSGALIENIFVDNINIESQGDTFIGGIAGGASGVHMSNCYVNNAKIDISFNGNVTYVGGLVGYSYQGNFTNCINMSKINITSVNSGMSGFFLGNLEDNASDPKGSVVDCIAIADLCVNNVKKNSNSGTISSPIINSYFYNYDDANINDYLPKDKRIINNISDFQKKDRNLTLGIYSNSEQINLNFDVSLTKLLELRVLKCNSDKTLSAIDDFINLLSEKQTELGSVSNRLDSVLDEILIQQDNLVASRSTIRDADIAEVSSQYIQQQILQEASATLLASTKNIQYQNVLGLLQSLRG